MATTWLMRHTVALLAVAAEAHGQDAAALAAQMRDAVLGVKWGESYRPSRGCRPYAGSVYGEPLNAPGAWSYHCAASTGAVTVESYYYAFGPAPVLLRDEIGLADEAQGASAEVATMLAGDLTARFGPGQLLELRFPLRPAGLQRPAEWRTPSGMLMLFDATYYLTPLRPRNGARLVAVSTALLQALDRDRKMPTLPGMPLPVNGYSCPKNPDEYREVIERAEAVLASRPWQEARLEALLELGAAHETWWSVALVPATDEYYGAYPRRAENQRRAGEARLRSVAAYEEILRIAPQSSYALFAARHLTRVKLGFDTGMRQWFCVID